MKYHRYTGDTTRRFPHLGTLEPGVIVATDEDLDDHPLFAKATKKDHQTQEQARALEVSSTDAAESTGDDPDPED